MLKQWTGRERVKQILSQKHQVKDCCEICGVYGVERHEMLCGRGKRNKSIEFSLFKYLCHIHHRDHKIGVHHNEVLMTKIRLQGKQDFIDACIESGLTPVEAEQAYFIEF